MMGRFSVSEQVLTKSQMMTYLSASLRGVVRGSEGGEGKVSPVTVRGRGSYPEAKYLPSLEKPRVNMPAL